MICVSIGRGRHKQMMAEHRHLVEQGAKLVELRLDYLLRAVDLKRLLADRPCPVIVTCRRERDGGKWAGTEQARQILLRAAIADGVDYVDLEEDIAGSIPRFGKTKRIVSYHNFRETPRDLEEIHARMLGLDPDIVKLATMAHDPRDNLRMLTLMQTSRAPTIGICMGEIGTPSRILAGRFGAPFTYATFHHERTLAPGQLSYRQMVDIYRYDEIGPQTDVYGVIADPVAHSLSPMLHNACFKAAGKHAVYVPFRVPREHLEEFLRYCRDLGVKGLSVTIPHKESVVPLLSDAENAVVEIGAANTLLLGRTETRGYNTDYRAILAALGLPTSPNPAQPGLAHKTALVLGAGGAARAAAYALRLHGAAVIISGRTTQRAEELATRLRCRSLEWDSRHGTKIDLLVNCTPVGMHPNVDETPFDKRHLRPATVVFDTVYNPEQTLLIKEAREQGCKIVTGVEMFVHQAALQFQHFTGAEPPLSRMRSVLRKAIGPARME